MLWIDQLRRTTYKKRSHTSCNRFSHRTEKSVSDLLRLVKTERGIFYGNNNYIKPLRNIYEYKHNREARQSSRRFPLTGFGTKNGLAYSNQSDRVTDMQRVGTTPTRGEGRPSFPSYLIDRSYVEKRNLKIKLSYLKIPTRSVDRQARRETRERRGENTALQGGNIGGRKDRAYSSKHNTIGQQIY